MILLLLFFLFAVIGVEMFGQTRYGYTYNVVSNMGTWPAVMHLLWRAATEAYRGAMYDLMVMSPTTSTRGDRFAQVSAPDCTLDENPLDGDAYNDCGNAGSAIFFFLVFQVA